MELTRLEVVECPHCAEPTMPNRLADGAMVCSCPAERPIPAPGSRLAPVPGKAR